MENNNSKDILKEDILKGTNEINTITILQPNNVKKEIIKKGNHILDDNPFFNGLDNVMQNAEFRNFYDKYFKDYSDIKTVILYMKLYQTIEEEYKNINGCDIDKGFLAYMLKELMCNDITRKNILKSFNDFTENNQTNKKYLLDIFDMDNMNKKYKKIC